MKIKDLLNAISLLPPGCPVPIITPRANFWELAWANHETKEYVTLDHYSVKGTGTIFTNTEASPMQVEEFTPEALRSRLRSIGLFG